MAEPKISMPNQESGEFILKDESQGPKAPPRRKKSLKKSKMEAENVRKITTSHSVKSENEQLKASFEEGVVEEGIRPVNVDDNNTNPDVSYDNFNEPDKQQLAQQLPKHFENEYENSKSEAQSKSNNEVIEESKVGGTPGSFLGGKIMTDYVEVSKIERLNLKDDNNLVKKVEITKDDEMGNSSVSIKSRSKNTEYCNPVSTKLSTENDDLNVTNSFNDNRALNSNKSTPAVVVTEHFETSFCLVENATNKDVEIKAQTAKNQTPIKEEEYSRSCADSEGRTSGLVLLDCDNLVDSDVNSPQCVNLSSCDSAMDVVNNQETALQEPRNGIALAKTQEVKPQLQTNGNNTHLDNAGQKDHENTVDPSSTEVGSHEDTSDFKPITTNSNTCEEYLQKESISETSNSTILPKLKQDSPLFAENSETGINNEVQKMEEVDGNAETCIPYTHFVEGLENEEDMCAGFDEDEYSSDTDSDTYYSDFTSSEGEYGMEHGKKPCGVTEAFNHKVSSPGFKEAEPESIKQILSAFNETETVTVTDATDGHHGNGNGSHGNKEFELSEARALSLKRKIGSFKIVNSLEPAVDEVDVKSAAVGMTTGIVVMETETVVNDSTKKAELALLALHKEHKMKHSGLKGRERRQRKNEVFPRERSIKNLEISRSRSLVGEPRTRSQSTGDLDNMARESKTRAEKINSLPVRAISLRLDRAFEVDEKSKSIFFNEGDTYLPGVLKGDFTASIGHLEDSKERHESDSSFKLQSFKEVDIPMVAEVGLGDECAPDGRENISLANKNISPNANKAPKVEASLDDGRSGTHDFEEERTRIEVYLSVRRQADSLGVEEDSMLRRPLSAVREESCSSLDSGSSFSLSTCGSSVSHENTPQAEEAVHARTSSNSNVSILECEEMPKTDDTIDKLEKLELKNGVQDEGSAIEIDQSCRGINVKTPSSSHKEGRPEIIGSSPKMLDSVDGRLEKANDSFKNVQLRQMKITQAKRKWLSQSQVVKTELPLSPTNVKLTSFKKNNDMDLQDSGFPDCQTGLESLADENTGVKITKQVNFQETQEPGTEGETTPTRPPRKGKPLKHSISFSESSRTPDSDNSRKTPAKQVKGSRKRDGLSRWQTLSGAIDADWLARLSSANKLPTDMMSEEQITLVTDAIPACFPTFPTDKRAQIALELYTTERTYVRGLEIVIELFKNPLEDYLENKEKATMFSNIDEIFKVNKDVLFSLCEKVNHWKDDQVIGDVFVENAARFKIYATYCNNYDAAETLVKQKVKKKKEFDDFLEACYKNEVCQPGLKLPAYLITVVQRIPRYLLLLRDLVKCTPLQHPDARTIKEGLHKMNNIAEYINNQLQAVQGQRAMTELRSRVIGIKAFETPGRSLIKEGEVYIMSTKRTYKCLLFNDMVVFAAKNVNKRSEVELTLEVESIWVADLEDNDPQTSKEDAIELYTPERSYTMYTGTRNEKKHWLQKLRTAIAIRLHGEMATDSSEIEHRKSDFTYKDGRIYCGTFVDGKRQGSGVLAWQNRTRYVGNFEDDERNGIGEITYSTGEKYKGEWLDDKQHGYGTITYPNNDVYTGEWKKGKMNGKGLITFCNDDILNGNFVDNEVCGIARLECGNGLTYDGTWKNSKKHGKGTLVKPNGDTYEGEFSNDRISGTGTMLYANRNEKYDGQWENNQRHGYGVYTVPNVSRFEGEWRGDYMSGRGKMTYANGDTYDGSWYRNMRFGKGILICQEGKYEGKFEYNVRHGIGQMHYRDNSYYEGEWQYDQRHGQGKMTYADSREYDGNWMQSLRNGRGKMTYPNGATYEGNWDLGSEHGPDGVFKDSANDYSYEGSWEYGCKQGKGVEKTSTGTYEGDFKANMRHGKGIETLKCGTVFEGHWKDNRKVGEVIRKTKWGERESSDVQYWKEGQLLNNDETIAPCLPFVQRITSK